MSSKIQGDYYWVRTKDSDWFIVQHDVNAAGGWTNYDTWEDFDKEIVEYKHIKSLKNYKWYCLGKRNGKVGKYGK